MKKDQYIGDLGARRKRRRLIYWGALIAVGLVAVFIIVMAVVVRSGAFRIREITVAGAASVPEENVDAFLRSRVTGDSFLKNLMGIGNILSWPGRFSPADLKLFPEAAAVTVSRNYFSRKVSVRIILRKEEGIWCFRKNDAANCFWFDENGRPFRRAPRSEGNLITVIDDYSRDNIPPGGALLPSDEFRNLLSVVEAVKAIDANVAEIRIEDLSLKEARVILAGGPFLKLSLEFPAGNIPQAFATLQGKTDVKKLEYIDFRVENHVYYK